MKLDSDPWWAPILRLLGWQVDQDFQIMHRDHQNTVRLWSECYPTKASAEHDCQPGQFVRRVINIWKD